METNVIGNYLIINFYGDIDSFAVSQYKDVLEKTINEEKFSKVAMDFTKVNFIDSSEIGRILSRYQQLKEKKIKITAYGINKTINRLFKVSGLWKIIENGDQKEKVVSK